MQMSSFILISFKFCLQNVPVKIKIADVVISQFCFVFILEQSSISSMRESSLFLPRMSVLVNCWPVQKLNFP